MNQSSKKPPYHNYVKYSTIAFQMMAIIGAGVIGGVQLDKLLNLKFPVFTVALSIVSVVLGVYLTIKDLIKFK
jgi:hypothetical protein